MTRMLPLLLISLLAIAGCSSGGDDSSQPEDRETPAAAQADPADEADSVEPAEPSAAAPTAPTGAQGSEPADDALDGSLATSTAGVEDTPLTLTLNAVERRGGTVNVTFSVTNDSSEEKWQVGTLFQGGRREDVEVLSTTAGVSVVDSQNGRRYPTVFDTGGVCLCDTGLSSRFVDPGQTARFSSVTGAPPEEVTEVDVQIPGFGTFSGIPLTP